MEMKFRHTGKLLLFFILVSLVFSLKVSHIDNYVSIKSAFCDPSEENVGIKEKNESTYITLENGMEFVLIENHSNPMIASVIAVKTGSRNESLNNSGVSHMLEHLLFNGTKNRTQEEIYDQMDFYGGYNNAHTTKDFTNFMILLPAEHIDNGLDIQSDMLFNSTIPEEKLEKERGIVIEEIGKDLDMDDHKNKTFFNRKLYGETSYALPVLGTASTITDMTREQIYDYYKKYYIPNNMTGMIIGDFDVVFMTKKLKKYFGIYPPKSLPFSKKLKVKSLNENNIYHAKDNVRKKYVNLGLMAPTMDNPDYFPFTIMVKMLNNNGQLMPGNNHKKESKKAADSISKIYAEFVSSRDISTLNIYSELTPDADVDEALHDILVNLQKISNRWDINPEEIRGIKTRIKTGEYFLMERMHYYGISKANMLVNGGYQFMESYLSNIERVTLKQVKRVIRKYLAVDTARFYRRSGKAENVNYVATIVEPLEKDKEKTLHGDALRASRDNLQRAARGDGRIVKKKILPNGLTLIVNENNDSRVFAAHVLFKDRCFQEPDGKSGIADFLHRIIIKGTTNKSEYEIDKIINATGARFTLYDDSYIPYDDYRSSPQYSFIRMETIDDFYEESLDLLADIVQNPTFEQEKIELVRKMMLNIINNDDSRVSKTAKNLFYKNLFPGLSLSKRYTGNIKTISSITRDDLVGFHKDYFSPNNMVINIVSSVSNDIIIRKIEQLFGSLSMNSKLKKPAQMKPQQISGIKEINVKKNKEQSYVYLGYSIANIEEKDEAPLVVLSSALSNAIAFKLREEQGLAYSIGCSIQIVNNMGWFVCNMGTRKMNIETARKGIIEMIGKYKRREYNEKEVEKAINKLRGRMMMRRLPRINQAYYASIYEFYKDDYSYDRKFIEKLVNVTPDDVKRVAEKIFTGERPSLCCC